MQALSWLYNDDTIYIKSEPRGVTFLRRGPDESQHSYDECFLRDGSETDEQIIARYKSTLDERLIRDLA